MYNQITLVGHLGADPEMRYTPAGVAVANFRMATSNTWNNAAGERQEKTTWFKVTVWGKQAEPVSQYLKKGSQVMVIGEMENPSAYVNRAGEPAASNEVKAVRVQFLGGKGQAEEEAPPTGYADSAPVQVEEDLPF